MSPRKRIPSDEVKSLLPIIEGLAGYDKDIAAECKTLLTDYFKIDPEKANYRLEGVEGAPLLAFVVAKSYLGCEVLYAECARHLDSETLNYFTNGRSLLSYLSYNNKWRSLLYTEKNFEMITADAFNFGGNMMPASIILLSHYHELFLDDFIAAKFQPLKCKQYTGVDLFDNLLTSTTGITVLMKCREIRDVLNNLLTSNRRGVAILRNRLEDQRCEILKKIMAKEAASLSYDDTSNLFQAGKVAVNKSGYQNQNNLRK